MYIKPPSEEDENERRMSPGEKKSEESAGVELFVLIVGEEGSEQLATVGIIALPSAIIGAIVGFGIWGVFDIPADGAAYIWGGALIGGIVGLIVGLIVIIQKAAPEDDNESS